VNNLNGLARGLFPMSFAAAGHADADYVRDLAQKMATAQGNEIVLTEQCCASAVPAPSSPVLSRWARGR